MKKDAGKHRFGLMAVSPHKLTTGVVPYKLKKGWISRNSSRDEAKDLQTPTSSLWANESGEVNGDTSDPLYLYTCIY